MDNKGQIAIPVELASASEFREGLVSVSLSVNTLTP
ncbi:hypothetical protein [Paenibacillus roseipurpureus]